MQFPILSHEFKLHSDSAWRDVFRSFNDTYQFLTLHIVEGHGQYECWARRNV